MTTTVIKDPTQYLSDLENRAHTINLYAFASTASLVSLQAKPIDNKNTYDELLFIHQVQKVLINEIASFKLDVSDLQNKILVSSQEIFNDSSLYRLKDNINRLKRIQNLEDNWDGYGAKSFDKKLIEYSIEIITSQELNFQPRIFPTLDGLVHFQFDISDLKHLEIQISLTTSAYYERIGPIIQKGVKGDKSEIIQLINEFYTK